MAPPPSALAATPSSDRVTPICATFPRKGAVARRVSRRGGSHPPAALRTGRDDLPSSGPPSPASDGGRELPVGKQVGLALACLLQPGRRLEVVASEPFELLSGPADQMIIDAPCEEAQLGAIARHHASPCSGTLLSQVAYPTLPSISSRTRSAVIRRIQSTKPHLTAHLGL